MDLDSIIRLSLAAEFRDPAAPAHLRRISELSELIAAGMNLPAGQVELIRAASPVHDIGKVGIPPAILLKPSSLTSEERKLVETHTLIGAEIIGLPSTPLLAMARDIALYHHERFDGGGYPQGLSGQRIPLPARIVCLADVFDALATPRCYKPAYPLAKVMETITRDSGGHFDPDCCQALLARDDQLGRIYPQAAGQAA